MTHFKMPRQHTTGFGSRKEVFRQQKVINEGNMQHANQWTLAGEKIYR